MAEAGFESAEPTAWLAEGLLIYLAAADAAQLLATIGEQSAPGSQLSFERSNAGTSLATPGAAQAGAALATDQLTSLWKGGLGQDATGWLTERGWQTKFHDLASVAASYGRPLARGSSRSGFVTATYGAGHRS